MAKKKPKLLLGSKSRCRRSGQRSPNFAPRNLQTRFETGQRDSSALTVRSSGKAEWRYRDLRADKKNLITRSDYADEQAKIILAQAQGGALVTQGIDAPDDRNPLQLATCKEKENTIDAVAFEFHRAQVNPCILMEFNT